jgi:glycolate oxidase FAD binding subunit
MRDLLIGVTFVRADGVVATAGGRVVKNVAGYDLGKLLTGSYGTLGVVTEAVIRLHPLPAARRSVTVETAGPAQAATAAAAVLGSQLVPAAVELPQRGSGPVTVTTLLQGVESGVEGRASAAAALVAPHGEVTTSADPPTAALPFDDGGTGLKVTVSASGVGAVLTTARELADVHQVDLVVRGSAVGVLHVGLPAETDPATVAAVIDALRATSATYGGGVTVLSAPADVRAEVDVWGPVPGIELMRRLKDEMDPGHRLSPGRFVGGI